MNEYVIVPTLGRDYGLTRYWELHEVRKFLWFRTSRRINFSSDRELVERAAAHLRQPVEVIK